MDKIRIRKLCRLALFEQKEERDALATASYYKRDYIGLGLLGNFILITVAYLILAVAVIVINSDFIINNFYRIDFYKVAAMAITGYALLLGLYSVLVFTLRRLKYAKAKRKVRNYYIALNQMYEENQVRDEEDEDEQPED